jgi:hypothetical protein
LSSPFFLSFLTSFLPPFLPSPSFRHLPSVTLLPSPSFLPSFRSPSSISSSYHFFVDGRAQCIAIVNHIARKTGQNQREGLTAEEQEKDQVGVLV